MSRIVNSIPIGFDDTEEEFAAMDWGRTAYDEATPRFHASVCCTPPRERHTHSTNFIAPPEQNKPMAPFLGPDSEQTTEISSTPISQRKQQHHQQLMETPPSNRKSVGWTFGDDNNTNMWFRSPARNDALARTPVTTPLRDIVKKEQASASSYSTPSRGGGGGGTPLRHSLIAQQLTPKGPSELPRAEEGSFDEVIIIIIIQKIYLS
jgi:hypothetical protein